MVIPRKELVGQDARLVGEVYHDAYTDALNQFATVDDIFKGHKGAIAAGGQIIGKLVFGTLGKTEHEQHLVSLVMAAANAGKWRAVVREPEVHTPGLDTVVEKHFGYVVRHDGKKFLLPSALYVVYCDAVLNS